MRTRTFTFALLAVATFAGRQAIASGHSEYRMSDYWPTGVHEGMVGVDKSDLPMCSALVNAVNRIAQGHPLKACPVVQFSSEISSAHWQPVDTKDPLALAEKLILTEQQLYRPDAKSLDDDALNDLKAKMADGIAHLETATVPGLRANEPSTRLLRLVTSDCFAHPSFYGGYIVIAEDAGFNKLDYIVGLGIPIDAFTYAGRSYLYGLDETDIDGASSRYVTLPAQHSRISAFQFLDYSIEGPGAVAMCRAMYFPTKKRR